MTMAYQDKKTKTAEDEWTEEEKGEYMKQHMIDPSIAYHSENVYRPEQTGYFFPAYPSNDFSGWNIYRKMSGIMSELGVVAKNLEVSLGQGRYKAVGEADVLHAVKPLEIKYGIYSYPLYRKVIKEDELVLAHTYTNRDGSQTKTEKINVFMRIETVYRFVNINNPSEYIDITSYGDGVDPQDKAPGKAMTYSDKYALLKAYKIQTGDDPDQEGSGEILSNTTPAGQGRTYAKKQPYTPNASRGTFKPATATKPYTQVDNTARAVSTDYGAAKGTVAKNTTATAPAAAKPTPKATQDGSYNPDTPATLEELTRQIKDIATELQASGVARATISTIIKQHFFDNGRPSANYNRITDIGVATDVLQALKSYKATAVKPAATTTATTTTTTTTTATAAAPK